MIVDKEGNLFENRRKSKDRKVNGKIRKKKRRKGIGEER